KPACKGVRGSGKPAPWQSHQAKGTSSSPWRTLETEVRNSRLALKRSPSRLSRLFDHAWAAGSISPMAKALRGMAMGPLSGTRRGEATWRRNKGGGLGGRWPQDGLYKGPAPLDFWARMPHVRGEFGTSISRSVCALVACAFGPTPTERF